MQDFTIQFKFDHCKTLADSSNTLLSSIKGDAINEADIEKVANTLKRMAASMSTEIQELKQIN